MNYRFLDDGCVELYDVKLGRGSFRNFSGEKRQYNNNGKRTFVAFLDEETGRALQERGWYLRWREPRDEMEGPEAWITPEVRFDKYRPKITLISGGVRTDLDESNIALLDTAEIKRCDVKLSPFSWNFNGQDGIKGFVRTMYVTLQDDDFGGMYAN